jgi:oxygen-independent coproporphyrinogen-3 oxidase
MEPDTSKGPDETGGSALDLLARVLQVLQRHEPALRGWTFAPVADGQLVSLAFDDGALTMHVAPPRGGACYARTPSLQLSIRSEGIPAAHERLLTTLVALLNRRDPGGLHVPTAPVVVPAGPFVELPPPPDAERAALTRARLKDELHFASFVAWKAVTTEDLYPHVGPLGEIIPTEDILAGWARTLARIRAGTAPPQLGLYVHVPFCTVACTFCFCGKTDKFDRAGFDAYVERLCEEAALFGPTFAGARFTSVYFGGGTPSLLSPPAMRKVFDALWRWFDVPPGTQIIYEGNPDSLSDRKIEELATTGRVTRLTIGVQTIDDAVQARVKRFNKPHQVRDAVASARRWGIEHVNLDLMAGLPDQTLASFLADLDFLVSLEPDTIHVNAYRPLPRVGLASQGDDFTPERIALRDEMVRRAADVLERAGHSFMAGGKRRRTANAANVQEFDLRRQNSSLLGLGFPARAHAFGGFYYAPDRREGLDGALRREREHGRRWWGVPADDAEERHKYLVSNLRAGWDRAEFQRIFGMDCLEAAPEALQKLQDLDVLSVGPGRVTSRTGKHSDNTMYAVLLYSPAFMARVRAGWGAEYDPGVDYGARLRTLVEDPGNPL